MPTENRSSNTEMVSVPREHELKIRQTPLEDLLSGLKTGEIRDCSDREFAVCDTVLLREIDDARDYTGTVARRTITHVQKHYGLPDHLCVLSYGQPAPQHPEPVAWMVGTAIWWTKEEAERDAAATGLPVTPVGPITESSKPAEQHQGALAIPEECPHLIVFDDTQIDQLMFAGSGARAAAMKKWAAISTSWNAHLFVRVARNSRDDGHLCATVADPGEVERLREQVETLRLMTNDYLLETERLRAQLAERDALLRDRFGDIRKLAERACGRPKDSPEYRSLIEAINPTMLLDLTALSASAEPRAMMWACRRCHLEQPTGRPCDVCCGKTELVGDKS